MYRIVGDIYNNISLQISLIVKRSLNTQVSRNVCSHQCKILFRTKVEVDIQKHGIYFTAHVHRYYVHMFQCEWEINIEEYIRIYRVH